MTGELFFLHVYFDLVTVLQNICSSVLMSSYRLFESSPIVGKYLDASINGALNYCGTRVDEIK